MIRKEKNRIMFDEPLTPENLIKFLNGIYGYFVLEKKKQIFNVMIKIYQNFGISKEEIGIFLCEYLRDVAEELANKKGE